MTKDRINLHDSTFDAIAKMSEGNPGAMNVLLQIISNKSIDPDNTMGGIQVVLFLDTLRIYGADIYVLHNDICDNDLAKTLAVLRATQFGMFPQPILKDACSRQDRSGKELVPVEELYLKVKERLPRFDQ